MDSTLPFGLPATNCLPISLGFPENGPIGNGSCRLAGCTLCLPLGSRRRLGWELGRSVENILDLYEAKSPVFALAWETKRQATISGFLMVVILFCVALVLSDLAYGFLL